MNKLTIVPALMRDTALGRVTGLDLFRMWKGGQIKTGETVEAIAQGEYRDLDAHLGMCNFNLKISAPEGAVFNGTPTDPTRLKPVGFPYDKDYNGSWGGDKGGWIFGNGTLDVGPGITIENFAMFKADGSRNSNSNMGGITRNWPGNFIARGLTVRGCDDNLRLMTAGEEDFTFVMDSDISQGGNGGGLTHNSYDHSLVKCYIRIKSGNCRVGHDLKPNGGGLNVIAHSDFRNDMSVPRGPSYAIDLNSGLNAIYDNDFNDEPNDQNQGTMIHFQTQRIWQGPHGLWFFGNRARSAVPYRGRFMVVDNTAYDPRIDYHKAAPVGFHDMTLYVGNNDGQFVDQKLDYGALGEFFHIAKPNDKLIVIPGNNRLIADTDPQAKTPFANLDEADFQRIPFNALLPRTADGWNLDVVQSLLAYAKQAQAAWVPPVDVATLPPLDPVIVVSPPPVEDGPPIDPDPVPDPEPTPAPTPDPEPAPVEDPPPAPEPEPIPPTDQETIAMLTDQIASLKADLDTLATQAQAQVDDANAARDAANARAQAAEDDLAARKAKWAAIAKEAAALAA